jgi:hypothetical protein
VRNFVCPIRFFCDNREAWKGPENEAKARENMGWRAGRRGQAAEAAAGDRPPIAVEDPGPDFDAAAVLRSIAVNPAAPFGLMPLHRTGSQLSPV